MYFVFSLKIAYKKSSKKLFSSKSFIIDKENNSVKPDFPACDNNLK